MRTFETMIVNGRVRPVVRGGEGPDPAEAARVAAAAAAAAAAAPAGDLTALQAELNRVGTREHAAGVRAAETALLQQYGFETREQMDAAIYAAHERSQRDMSAQQRAEAAAEAARRQSEQATATANAATRQAIIREAIVDAGVSNALPAGAPAGTPTPRDLVARLVDIPDQATAEQITGAIEAVRLTAPALFGPAPAGGFVPAPSSLPHGGPRPAPPNPATAVEDRLKRVTERTGIR